MQLCANYSSRPVRETRQTQCYVVLGYWTSGKKVYNGRACTAWYGGRQSGAAPAVAEAEPGPKMRVQCQLCLALQCLHCNGGTGSKR
jgi:hypothetical protein